MRHGALDWLPASLVLAFCFTPSVSAAVFRAWHCVSYAYDEMEDYSFLAQDLSVRCDGSDEHNSILAIAWVLVIIWPIGMLVLYGEPHDSCRRARKRTDGTDSVESFVWQLRCSSRADS